MHMTSEWLHTDMWQHDFAVLPTLSSLSSCHHGPSPLALLPLS